MNTWDMGLLGLVQSGKWSVSTSEDLKKKLAIGV